MKVNAEKGEGPEIAKKYEVTGFPTMVVIDPKGEELDRIVGFRPPKELLKSLKPILEGKSFAALKKKVAEKPSDLEATVALGQKYEEREDIDKAEDLFKRVQSAKDAPAESLGPGAETLAITMRVVTLIKPNSPVSFSERYT